ncbi:MAG TPA: nuclear transport factor 2 family protein, partial [Streptosporangiaceae bacterium]|nr:nuclear transport factor 2 family protein [Streptosporangiaceae bacterium]
MASDPVSPNFVSMAQTPDPTPFEEAEVSSFVRKVYRELFDAHAPLDVFLTFLDDEELEMRFPEETVRGHAGFQRWYERIVNTFFDETHTIRELETTSLGDRATVRVLVNWQAYTWQPPAAKSEWSGHDAGQTWVVKRSPEDGQPLIVTYTVDTYVPMEACSVDKG